MPIITTKREDKIIRIGGLSKMATDTFTILDC